MDKWRGDPQEIDMTKKEDTYWTILMRYETDAGEPCDPPPHLMERMAQAMSILHEVGWQLAVIYGQATKEIEEQIDTGEGTHDR